MNFAFGIITQGIMHKPLLSICIPTYNRAKYLDQCLKAIVGQEWYDDRVEVVVSDNCSTDNTMDIVRSYQVRFGNIRYFRNDENLADKNFSLSLRRASGILRKLTNDTVIYKSGAIKYMVSTVEKYIEERPQVYFLSTGALEGESIHVTGLEQYIDTIGYNLTWIRALSIWEDDCDDLDILAEEAGSNMGQIPFLLHQFKKHGGAIILDEPIMDAIPVDKKNLSYGLHRVFYINFLGFIRPYVEIGEISQECYENLRKKLLFGFFGQWIINLERHPERYIQSDENLPKLIRNEYKDDNYYPEFQRKMVKLRLRAVIGRMLKRG